MLIIAINAEARINSIYRGESRQSSAPKKMAGHHFIQENANVRSENALLGGVFDINRLMFLRVIYDQAIYEQKQCTLYILHQIFLPDIAPQELSGHKDR
jgi:hypothetical protein